MTIWTLLLVGAGGVALGVLVHETVNRLVRYIEWRTRDIAAATVALEDYEKLMDRIMGDPATPSVIKDFLCDFDQAVGHKIFATRVLQSLYRKRVSTERATTAGDELQAAVENLRTHRSDLANDLEEAIASGFATTILRWPLTAILFQGLMRPTKRDAITPARTLMELTGSAANYA